MPENRKRTVIYLLVLLGLLVGIFWILSKNSSPASSTPQAGLAPGGLSSSSAARELLPYGSKLDTSILESEDFKALRAALPVGVTEEELGKSDLFTR